MSTTTCLATAGARGGGCGCRGCAQQRRATKPKWLAFTSPPCGSRFEGSRGVRDEVGTCLFSTRVPAVVVEAFDAASRSHVHSTQRRLAARAARRGYLGHRDPSSVRRETAPSRPDVVGRVMLENVVSHGVFENIGGGPRTGPTMINLLSCLRPTRLRILVMTRSLARLSKPIWCVLANVHCVASRMSLRARLKGGRKWPVGIPAKISPARPGGKASASR